MDFAGGGTKGLKDINKDIRKKYFDAKNRDTDEGLVVTLGNEEYKLHKNCDFKSNKVTIKFEEEYELSEFISQFPKFIEHYGKNIENISVYLSGVNLSELTVKKAKSIAPYLKNIKVLNLSGTYITPASFTELLKETNSLEELNLLYVGLSELDDKQAESIAPNLKNIKVLNLSGTNVYSPSLALLLKHTNSLEELWISSNNFDDDDVKYIAEALKKNQTIKFVDLSENFIGSNVAYSLVKALKKNTSITHIDLSNNKIGEDLKKELRKITEKNKVEIIF